MLVSPPHRCFYFQLWCELWPGAAEGEGTECPRRRRREFRATDSHGGPAGDKAACEAEPLQRRDRRVRRAFPILPGAKHAGERDAENRHAAAAAAAPSHLCSSHLQQFIQDLMDGYFPSELQSKFPDGIPFEVLWLPELGAGGSIEMCNSAILFFFEQVHDRRNEEFVSRLAFPGKRQAGDLKKKNKNITPTFETNPSFFPSLLPSEPS